MAQVSWRASDEIVERAKRAARRADRSLNEYLTLVVSAATDPSTAGSELEQIRERLERAGLLEAPSGRKVHRPTPDAVAAAGARAARGTPLDELVSSGR
jgi:hypothetical protein